MSGELQPVAPVILRGAATVLVHDEAFLAAEKDLMVRNSIDPEVVQVDTYQRVGDAVEYDILSRGDDGLPVLAGDGYTGHVVQMMALDDIPGLPSTVPVRAAHVARILAVYP